MGGPEPAGATEDFMLLPVVNSLYGVVHPGKTPNVDGV
jgi:hypothetical protein